MPQAQGRHQNVFREKVLLLDYPRGLGFGYSKRDNSLGMIPKAVIL